jgi:hypothetical protein
MKIQSKALLGRKGETLLAISGMLLLPGVLGAQTYTLFDPGSTATVNLSGPNAGMDYWAVDADPGVNQLDSQWFYYSYTGSGGVQAINALSVPTVEPDSTANFLDLTYASTQLSINIQYSFTGGGYGGDSADIFEAIAINNLSGVSINNLQFYQYSNFNLLQNNANSVSVIAGQFAQQTAGSTAIGEAVINPAAAHSEAGIYSTVLTDILSGNNLTGPMNAGPGNVAWGFQWDDASLSAAGNDGDEFDIQKDKSLSISNVPEPTTFALLGLGLGAVGFIRRRKTS